MINYFFAALIGAVTITAEAGVKIEHWRAPSGASVYFVESHELPMIDVALDFVAGSALDPADKAGLAGLTRGLLDAGTAEMDEEQIAGRLVDLGALLNGSGDFDRSGLTLRTLSSKAEKDGALELLRNVISTPTFPDAVLTREKAQAIAALEQADTQPESIAAKRFAAAIYPDHPYGATPTVDSVKSISRDDLAAFHHRYYSAARAVVAIMGDVSRAEAETIAQHLTDQLPVGEPQAVMPPIKLPERQTFTIPHPAAQSHILIGAPAVKRGDPDFFPLLVGNYSLGGGGFVSRLMNEVREKRGYAYDVHSYFAPRKFEGPFQIGLQTKRSQTQAALKVVETTLSDFLKNGPTESEQKAAKQNLVDGLALRIDSNAKILGYLSTIGFYGLPLDYLDTFAAKVNAVTAAQVREAFARHVQPEHLVTVVVAGE
jgi:zinc protease